MTPEQMNEINLIAKGDPVRVGLELCKIVNAQEDKIKQLRDRLTTAEEEIWRLDNALRELGESR